MTRNEEEDDKLLAAINMVGRMGGQQFELRFDDRDVKEGTPTVWMALARWGVYWEATGGTTPWRAVFRLLEAAMDGGTCQHCGKMTGVDESPPDALLALTESFTCWYRYDPERKTFRRQCEGVAP